MLSVFLGGRQTLKVAGYIANHEWNCCRKHVKTYCATFMFQKFGVCLFFWEDRLQALQSSVSSSPPYFSLFSKDEEKVVALKNSFFLRNYSFFVKPRGKLLGMFVNKVKPYTTQAKKEFDYFSFNTILKTSASNNTLPT